MRYLGIDYGKKKIGLALSEGLTASPLKVIDVTSLKDAVTKIIHISRLENIDVLIVGLPESGESRKLVESFSKEAKKEGLKIETVDETLSSKRALDDMINLNLSKKSRGREDAYSAALILQEYLDNK